MRILQVDTQEVREPDIVITCATDKNIDRIARDMLQENGGSQQQQQQQQQLQKQQRQKKQPQQHYVTVVTDENKNMVAVDNIEVLQAARRAKTPKIPVLLLGKKDPMATHISMLSAKPMVNPVRIGQALRLVRGDMADTLYLNSYVKTILQVEFAEDVTVVLADFLDEMIKKDVRLSPPFSFFLALSKLDHESQITAILSVSQIYRQIDLRHFTWPDSALFHTMLCKNNVKGGSKLKESPSEKISRFDCTSCGTRYALVDNKVHVIKNVNGCMFVQDELGTVLHAIPETELKFLEMDPDSRAPPRFSRHRNVKDLKNLKIKGPFLLVRVNRE